MASRYGWLVGAALSRHRCSPVSLARVDNTSGTMGIARGTERLTLQYRFIQAIAIDTIHQLRSFCTG